LKEIDVIRYLVKFVAKESYADDLLKGKLFMHCARYYHDLEIQYGPGQGDLREGTIFPNFAMYQYINFPIFCMYMVKDQDIEDGHVLIDMRLIKDFDCQQGFMVIIPFEPFEYALSTANTEGYAMNGAEVSYGIQTPADIEIMFNSDNALNLVVKHPHFSYQKEYRLIVYKDIYKDDFPDCLNETRSFTCHLSKPISGFAKKVPISELKETSEGFVLNLRELFPI
jgi:hypothetical protein